MPHTAGEWGNGQVLEFCLNHCHEEKVAENGSDLS